MTTMKKILYIISMAVAITFASCQKDLDVVQAPNGGEAVTFSAESISTLTKVSGTSWNKGDAIGITMISSVEQSVVYDNYKYLAAQEGTTVSFTPDSKVIYFTEEDTVVDFIAHHPFQESWSYKAANMLLDISGQDGTQAEQDKIDLLISNNRTAQTSGEQTFQFTHALSKVQITVSNHEVLSAYEDLNALSATIYDAEVEYDAASTSRASQSTTANIMMVKTATDNDSVIFTAIITPGEVDYEIIFSDGEKSYSSTLAIQQANGGKQYNFSTTVGDQGFSTLILSSDNVTDWSEQENSALDVDIQSAGDLYQIYTAAGVKIFADMVNSGQTLLNGQLMNNIDLAGSESNQWCPIGTNEYMFGGTFNGGGFEISGLYQNGQELSGFIHAANEAVIKNLSVSGEISCAGFSAGVVSFARNSTIISCHSNVALTSTSRRVGGICGYSSNSAIINCYNSGVINSSSTDAGGIVGMADDDGSLINCYNIGKVSASGSYGAIVGSETISGEVTNSFYLDSSCAVGDGDSYLESYMIPMSSSDMQSTPLLYHLNNGAYIYNQTNPTIKAYAWKAIDGDYPLFDTENEPTYKPVDINYDTKNSLYQIYTGDGLRAFADLVNGVEQSVSDLFIDNCSADIATYFNFGTAYNPSSGKLMSNIDLGGIDAEGEGIAEGQFSPIGNSSYFTGQFDGDNHTISGLYINAASSTQGLFGRINGATIKNVSVSGSVSGTQYIGGIVGYAISSATIYNCNNAATIEGTAGYIGGIVGYTSHASSKDDPTDPTMIQYCHNSGLVKGGKSCVGGIAGYASATTIQYCYNTATIYQSSDGSAGGIAGRISQSDVATTMIDNCYNTAKVDSDGGTNVGGITGNNYLATVSNCYNRGSVEGSNTYVGGISGKGATEQTCYNTGSVTGISAVYTGGVAGGGSSATYCYYDSDVVSGVSGTVGNTNNGTIYCGLSTTMMKGDATTQGTALYYFTNSEHGASTSWRADTGINDGYPILKWQVTE